MENFSQRLREAIRNSGKSKGAIAQALGVPQSSVSRWLAGSDPKAERVSELAKLLSVDVNWLLGGDPAAAGDPAPVVRSTAAPLRQPGEPSLTERLAAMEENTEAMRSAMDEMRRALEELTDLFTTRRKP